MDIPNGFGIVSFTWTITGTAKNIVNTHGTSVGASTTAEQVRDSWLAIMSTTSFRPYSAASFASGYSLVEVKALCRIGGNLYSASTALSTLGGSGSSALPINTAMLVSKRTGIAGRKYRGRVFAPWGIQETNVNQVGIIDAPQVTTYQGYWNAAVTALSSAGHTPVLLHSDNSAPTTITEYRVEQKIATIGRRLR